MRNVISLLIVTSCLLTPALVFADPLVGTKLDVNGQTEVITEVKRDGKGKVKKVETVNTETGEKITTKVPKEKKEKKK